MFKDLVDSFTNLENVKNSFKNFWTEFSVSTAVTLILVIFMIVGLVDKLRGNKHGYGEKFDEAFNAMGPLALSVVGIVAVSPVIMTLLGPLITPVFSFFGISPAMFPGSLLALDMGGYFLAQQFDPGNLAAVNYGGIIVASTMGITICFTIPYALTVMKKKDQHLLAKGILIGLITLPVGCFVGGLAMYATNTPLKFTDLLLNTVPVLLLAVIMILGLLFTQKFMMKAFTVFGKVMTTLIIVSLGIAIFQYLTGLRIPLLEQMVEPNEALGGVPFEVGLLLVGLIAIVLAGAFPMILFLNRRLKGVMNKFGKYIGINTAASTGLLTQLASSIPVLSVIDDMDDRGKLMNIAFAVSGSFVFADVLAFVGANVPDMMFPVIINKLVGGILALVLSVILMKKNVVKLGSGEEEEKVPTGGGETAASDGSGELPLGADTEEKSSSGAAPEPEPVPTG